MTVDTNDNHDGTDTGQDTHLQNAPIQQKELLADKISSSPLYNETDRKDVILLEQNSNKQQGETSDNVQLDDMPAQSSSVQTVSSTRQKNTRKIKKKGRWPGSEILSRTKNGSEIKDGDTSSVTTDTLSVTSDSTSLLSDSATMTSDVVGMVHDNINTISEASGVTLDTNSVSSVTDIVTSDTATDSISVSSDTVDAVLDPVDYSEYSDKHQSSLNVTKYEDNTSIKETDSENVITREEYIESEECDSTIKNSTTVNDTEECHIDNNTKNHTLSEQGHIQNNALQEENIDTSAEVVSECLNRNNDATCDDEEEIDNDGTSVSNKIIKDYKNGTIMIECNKYNLDLTNDDEILLKLESLQARQNRLCDEISVLTLCQQQLVTTWKSQHLSEDQINKEIKKLQEEQNKLEASEDYDAAAEIQQQIQDLHEQCDKYKYQHPVFNDEFIKLLDEYKTLQWHQSGEKKIINGMYEEILSKQRQHIKEEDKNQEKTIDEEQLILQENKLKLERAISHVALDQEHLLKNENVLKEEIIKKTKDFNLVKEQFVVKRSHIQADIEELNKQLHLLQEEEEHFTQQINEVNEKIEEVFQEFEPRIHKIENEKEITKNEELKLNNEMEELNKREQDIEHQKQLITLEKQRKEDIIKKLEAHLEELSNSEIIVEETVGSFSTVFNVELIDVNADDEYKRLENKQKELQQALYTLSKTVLEDENNLSKIQRSLNDLETQLSELQSMKQTSVKERNYKEAKRISDEIKNLMAEGEIGKEKLLQLSQSIKPQQEKVKELEKAVSQATQVFQKKEKEFDLKVIENLGNVKETVESYIESDTSCWIKDILELEVYNCNCIITSLNKKYGLSSNEVDGKKKVEDIKEAIEELESQLLVAENQEDWDRADEINDLINKQQQLLQVS